MTKNSEFKSQVEELVNQIPRGQVMTYGQIATLCGRPRAARIVGGIAHWGDPELPWHRVVNSHGGLAIGYPGGVVAHQQHLEDEGIGFTEGRLNLQDYQWQPN